MSLSTWLGSTSWRTNTSAASANNERRKPSRMRGSGRPVMRNLTFGISDTSCPRTERMAEAGSSSLHSSKASMMTTVEMADSRRGLTISLCNWSYKDSWAILGSDRIKGTNNDWKSGYLRASWTAIVGKMKWRLLLPQNPVSKRRHRVSRQKRPLGDCLEDRGLPRSGQPVQPVDRGLVEISGPESDLIQNNTTCSLETASAVAMSIFEPLCAEEAVESSHIGCWRFMSGM